MITKALVDGVLTDLRQQREAALAQAAQATGAIALAEYLLTQAADEAPEKEPDGGHDDAPA